MNGFVRQNLLLLAATGTSRALAIVTFVLMARYLGPEELGKYVFAITLVGYFGVLTDLAINPVAIRAVAQERAAGVRYYTGMLALRLGAVALVLIALGVVALWLDKPMDVKAVIMIAALGLLVTAITNSNTALFSAFKRFEYVAFSMILVSGLNTLAVVWLLMQGYGIVAVALAQIIGNSAACIVSCWLLARHVIRRLELDLGFCKTLLRQTLPFTFASVLGVLYNRLDVTILSFLAGDRAVGWYGSIYLIVSTLLILLPGTFTAVLYPNLARIHRTTPAQIAQVLPLAHKVMLIVGLPIALTGVVMAEPIVRLLYGAAFGEAAPLLQILIWILPLGALCGVSMFAAYSMNQERAVWRIMAILLAVNVVGNLIVVPHYAARGAALVAVACQILNLALFSRLMPKPTFDWSAVIRTTIALLGLTLTLLIAREQFLPLALILGTLVYEGSLVLLRVITRTEWRLLKQGVEAHP